MQAVQLEAACSFQASSTPNVVCVTTHVIANSKMQQLMRGGRKEG